MTASICLNQGVSTDLTAKVGRGRFWRMQLAKAAVTSISYSSARIILRTKEKGRTSSATDWERTTMINNNFLALTSGQPVLAFASGPESVRETITSKLGQREKRKKGKGWIFFFKGSPVLAIRIFTSFLKCRAGPSGFPALHLCFCLHQSF